MSHGGIFNRNSDVIPNLPPLRRSASQSGPCAAEPQRAEFTIRLKWAEEYERSAKVTVSGSAAAEGQFEAGARVAASGSGLRSPTGRSKSGAAEMNPEQARLAFQKTRPSPARRGASGAYPDVAAQNGLEADRKAAGSDKRFAEAASPGARDVLDETQQARVDRRLLRYAAPV